MAAAPRSIPLRRVLGVLVVVAFVAAAAVFAVVREEMPASGPTVEEKIAVLRTERASLQARADSEARIGLLSDFRTASLLFDALAVRSDSDSDRAFDQLPAFRRQAFGEIDALNAALKEALDRPGEGARLAAHKAALPAAARLERLAAEAAPLILSYTPRFVPPRRAPANSRSPPARPERRRRAHCGSTARVDRRPSRLHRRCRAMRRISPRQAMTIRPCRSRSWARTSPPPAGRRLCCRSARGADRPR
ncbi:MAG: hypothetical protein K2X72_33135 [Reyranella sp.]|nr:hypothetical protein [Reyranella sp.]